MTAVSLTACPECQGRGKVYAHDPSGDGHGGLNGGRWDWFVCSDCEGTGDSSAPERRRAAWPETWTLRVCPTCGTPKTTPGWGECEGPYCSTQSSGEQVTVRRV